MARRTARVVNKLPEFVGTTKHRAARTLLQILIRGGSEVAPLVPIETSTLINSQYREINLRGEAIVGRLGFTAEYALAVHESAGKWVGLNKPRPKVNGHDRGVYWGPHDGQPKFLALAFQRAADDIDGIVKRGMKA